MDIREALGVLGIVEGASGEQLKAAYRRESMRHHPDRNPGDEGAASRFGRVKLAYDTLTGKAAPARPEPGAGQPPRPPRTVAVSAEISLEKAFSGGEVVVGGGADGVCGGCGGRGEVECGPRACETCGGKGATQRERGIVSVRVPCPACGGLGTVTKAPCGACGGEPLAVELPAGVEDGAVLHYDAPGGRRVAVSVRVAKHPEFQRRGADLGTQVLLSFADACLGCERRIRGIDGADLCLAVPPGTQPGTQFRLRGQGMPDGTGRRGDLVVRATVAVPTSLTGRQADLLARWREEEALARETG